MGKTSINKTDDKILNISLTEYNDLVDTIKKLKKENKDLKLVSENKGKVIITRYDYKMSDSMIQTFIRTICDTYDRLINQPKFGAITTDSYGSPIMGSYNVSSNALVNALEDFFTRFFNTTSLKDCNLETTTIKNFTDVEEDVRKLIEHKYFSKLGEKENQLNEMKKEADLKQKELEDKIKKFEKDNNHIIESYKDRADECEKKWKKTLNEKTNLEIKVNQFEHQNIALENEVKSLNEQLELCRTTIQEQKELREADRERFKSKGLFSFLFNK